MDSRGVVLLHGLGVGPGCWAGVTARLPAHVVTSTPQICATDGSVDFSLDRAIHSTTAALTDLGTSRRTLVGHSLGAVVALAAVDAGAAVDHLVLISGFVRAPRRLLSAQAAIFGIVPQRVLGPTVDRAALIGPMKSLRHLDLGAAVTSISAPTTVICGSRDLLNRRQARLAATLIPNASLLLLPGVGHMVPEQAPEQIAAQLP